MEKMSLVGAILLSSLLAFYQDQSAPSVVNINISISQTVPAVNYLTNTSTKIGFKATPYLPY
ncbi:MAG: hypothetical protein WA741_31405, partial [Candidatus Sulfotelmatobacter sp.]